MANTIPCMKLNTGHSMPALGLGTWNYRLPGIYDAVKTAIDVGYRHIDTAWVYESEADVGKAVKEKISEGVVSREDVFITTKLGNYFHDPDEVAVGLRESLDDLKTSYVDLYLMHWPVSLKKAARGVLADDTDYIDTWRAMEKLVDAGKARAIGISNFNMAQVERLLQTDGLKYKPANLQIEMNPYITNTELMQFCLEQGISVTSYSPLTKGVADYQGEGTFNILEDDVVTKVARQHSRTPAQVVLRWTLQRGCAVMVKSCSESRIRENFQICDFSLTNEEMAAITNLNINQRLVKRDNMKSFPWYPF
ncbi:aldo-keto reductase family 1 member B1-like [Gigantopelta aegis]|uniref:aldo-keto reductase family 1 member B1-like n=1 Tax=Gigantopelta aegis TaxID=1735272 RepID=UPI001B88BF1D|nr:aldo-keto reductase family 1 member B1-like [Gigantopelta aegis]